jgi:hypothetical protein
MRIVTATKLSETEYIDMIKLYQESGDKNVSRFVRRIINEKLSEHKAKKQA